MDRRLTLTDWPDVVSLEEATASGRVARKADTTVPPQRALAVDGKFFTVSGRRFPFRGVTYGTFRPRVQDGQRFPQPEIVATDLAAMRTAGFTVVRTYHPPSEDLLLAAGEQGMRLMSDVFFLDWRYLLGAGRREESRVAREASREVRAVARRLTGDERIAALSLGNEIPADVLRWMGTARVASVLARLVDAVRDEDGDRLVTYANYPTAEYLPLSGLDFLTFNVFLEDREDLRRYLTHLHHLAGDRPLVLGEVGHEVGPDEHGEISQAAQLDEQLSTVVERGLAGFCVFSWTDEWWVGDAAVTGWHFGLTREDRSPRPALAAVERWNRTSVSDLDYDWPSISVVVCAYNAAATLGECLRHACALDYPRLEILVVDDGSTDETAAIAAADERVRLLSLPHGGLSVARNEGFRAAGGELIAYLDSDAYPTPEWPYFLALGLDGPRVAGVGGPNVPPRGDPKGAQKVARAPGGPVHVLLADDRAEHVPGCNMAFWRELLIDVGGFDPIYTSAGDDVDMCWKVIDRGWEIGFHPAALVWHHARVGLRTYLRQQRGYGRAEALVEARHPHRFNASGAARWRGHIYDGFAPRMLRQRVYRGVFGAAAYQSVYRRRNDGVALTRQVGVPVAVACLPSLALAAASPYLAVPAVLALALLVGLFAREAAIVTPPRACSGRWRFRIGVALLSMLQPLSRTWGQSRSRGEACEGLVVGSPLPEQLPSTRRRVILVPEDRPREELAATLVFEVRRCGMRVIPASGWDDHDAVVTASTLVQGHLLTSAHPQGCVHARIRLRPRWSRVAALAVALGLSALTAPAIAAVLLAVAVADLTLGCWRPAAALRRAVEAPVARRGGGWRLLRTIAARSWRR